MKSMRRSRRRVGLSVCLSVLLLLLMVMQLENAPCYGYGHQEKINNRLSKGNTGSSGSSNPDHYKPPRVHPVKSKGAGGGDDDIFGAEKRKIRTGPNPLHNRYDEILVRHYSPTF